MIRASKGMGRRELPVAVLAVAVLLAVSWVVVDRSSPPNSGAVVGTETAGVLDAPAVVLPMQPSALWVGDDYTAGVGRIDNASYARIVCSRMGWACNVDAQGSTGFLDDGAAEYEGATQRLPARLAFDRATFRADVILVDAGRNDLEVPATELLSAMSDYVNALRDGWPTSRIVIIVPTFMSPVPYDGYDEFVAGIGDIADRVDADVLDPIALGWYAGVDIPSMQIEDRVHPNAVGNAYLAGVIERDLRALGLDRVEAGGSPS